jgi:hypothetical protein
MDLPILTNFKLLSMALAILGAIVATLLIGWFGFGRIAGAILRARLRAVCRWQVLLFVLMGVAWWAVVPPGEGRLPVFVWGRMVTRRGGALAFAVLS